MTFFQNMLKAHSGLTISLITCQHRQIRVYTLKCGCHRWLRPPTTFMTNRKLLTQQWWQLCYLLITSKFRKISQTVCSIHAVHTCASTNFINVTLIYCQVWSDGINLTAWNIWRLVDKQVIPRVNRNQSLHKVVKVWLNWFLIIYNLGRTI